MYPMGSIILANILNLVRVLGCKFIFNEEFPVVEEELNGINLIISGGVLLLSDSPYPSLKDPEFISILLIEIWTLGVFFTIIFASSPEAVVYAFSPSGSCKIFPEVKALDKIVKKNLNQLD